MEAKKLTANQVKNLVNSVKAIYRLNGFVTDKRTNLQKALKECRFDYAELGKGIDTSLSFPESVFEKEYQFEDSKCYLFQLHETKYLIVSGFGYCNIYRLVEKTKSEKFEDQSSITYNGDSKKAVLDYNDKKIELTCTLSNTKVYKWDSKYPESHNHYIIKFKFGKGSARFDFFDSLHNFETGQTDKTEMDIFEMFYSFLSDCRIVIDCYSFEDFQAEFEGTKEGYNACKRALQKFERVFCSSGIDLYDLSNYLQEKYNF